MGRTKKLPQHPLLFASPWLLAAAIGILLGIVIFFTVNNLQRERRLITESLFHRGMSVIRFVGAGTRASMMMGGVPAATQMQHLVEQAAGESGILYIAVVDEQGRILAHSNRQLVGTTLDHQLAEPSEMPPRGGRHRILERPSAPHKVFEVTSLFRPFHGRGPGAGRFMHMPPPMGAESENGGGHGMGPGEWCRQQPMGGAPPPTDTFAEGRTRFIMVGLDMSEEEKVIRQDLYHILFISLAILLVGIGSWMALLSAQGHKSAQQTLRYIQAFTGLIISRLPVGIIATDQEGCIKTFNAQAGELTGIAADFALNRKAAEVLPPSLAPFFTPATANEELLERELDLTSGANAVTLHASSVPVSDDNATVIGRVLLLHDLTRLKTLEKEMRKHERLVSLGKMAAGVAHEVRNPLSSIKGLAALLGSAFAETSQERHSASLLIQEVERLNRAITELLNYAKPLPLNRESLDLEPLLANSLALIAGDAASMGVAVSHDVAPDLPPALGDRDRLNQVLLNLYLNSLQAMEQGGTLTVTARLGEKRGTVQITVQDTGSGIAAEILDRIMDPYFTTKPQGSGLGLAMVQKILDEHGGEVRVTSSVGEGTSVTLTLPAV
ncbi:MAG: ATP-binding protein [Thermodesulfobacteriota bacterium]